MRCVGGPLDGQDIDSPASVIELAEAPAMAYVRTRPTDTNWRDTIDHDWWMHGTPEPVPPEHVYEWHERGWVSPEVAMIRSAVREAAERF